MSSTAVWGIGALVALIVVGVMIGIIMTLRKKKKAKAAQKHEKEDVTTDSDPDTSKDRRFLFPAFQKHRI
jgi:uncharacterized membrane-anchored protein YhcB (DUF1043 family)